MDSQIWSGKKVLVTGHTGFKGAWLTLWLRHLGAEVFGYALNPATEPNLYDLCLGGETATSVIGDIRDAVLLKTAMREADPDVVFHMAAQPLVRTSYESPAYTYEVNVMGTVNVLEALRDAAAAGPRRPRAAVIVTSDKCYDNREWYWGYREQDPLGGYDPYSSSKACAELAAASYRLSFFHPDEYAAHGVAVATARAGNVIGGGDWSADRLIPDVVRSLTQGYSLQIRYPGAVRPWQHVLEPLGGYLLLAERLLAEGPRLGESWNFGPDDGNALSVEELLGRIGDRWGSPVEYRQETGAIVHEARSLRLDCSKARQALGWSPIWSIDETLDRIVEWVRAYEAKADMRQLCLEQIADYMRSKPAT